MGCEVCTCKVLEGDMQDAVMGYRSERAEASSMGRFKQLSRLPVPVPITRRGSGSKAFVASVKGRAALKIKGRSYRDDSKSDGKYFLTCRCKIPSQNLKEIKSKTNN